MDAGSARSDVLVSAHHVTSAGGAAWRGVGIAVGAFRPPANERVVSHRSPTAARHATAGHEYAADSSSCHAGRAAERPGFCTARS